MDIKPCPYCGNEPSTNEYVNDGSFYHTSSAIIKCDSCGFRIEIETYNDRDLDKGNGYDVQLNQYRRAMSDASIKWLILYNKVHNIKSEDFIKSYSGIKREKSWITSFYEHHQGVKNESSSHW